MTALQVQVAMKASHVSGEGLCAHLLLLLLQMLLTRDFLQYPPNGDLYIKTNLRSFDMFFIYFRQVTM